MVPADDVIVCIDRDTDKMLGVAYVVCRDNQDVVRIVRVCIGSFELSAKKCVVDAYSQRPTW